MPFPKSHCLGMSKLKHIQVPNNLDFQEWISGPDRILSATPMSAITNIQPHGLAPYMTAHSHPAIGFKNQATTQKA